MARATERPAQLIVVSARIWTGDAAHPCSDALAEEGKRGRVAPGLLADFVLLSREFVLLSREIVCLPPGEIVRTEVDTTVVGGRVVYERKSK